MARHTTLSALPAPPTHAHLPDAALPCRRRPDVFQHPLLEEAGDTGDAPGRRHRYAVLLRTARDLCASCPLWAECLQDAVAYAEPDGYAAATTRDDRRWIRRALGLGDPDGNLPVRATEGIGAPRRLARLRSRSATDPALPELERVLDAFDALQERLAERPEPTRQSGRPAPSEPPGPYRSTTPTRTEGRNDEMAAAEAGHRISFSYEDPAQAVRQALLGPLVRTALPSLNSLELFVTMLVSVPGSEVTPQTVQDIRAVRSAVASLLPESAAGTPADAVPPAPPRALTGSVSVELATTDPVAALRRDVVEPLLRDLSGCLGNIEKVASMLAAAAGETDPRLDVIRSALHDIRSRLPHPPAPGPPRRAAAPAGRAAAAVPSIRSAVERAVTSFPGPFSARDVLRALPPGVYGDPAKTISNVLAALVKSDRLQRLSRGTYAQVRDLADERTDGADGADETQSA